MTFVGPAHLGGMSEVETVPGNGRQGTAPTDRDPVKPMVPAPVMVTVIEAPAGSLRVTAARSPRSDTPARGYEMRTEPSGARK